MHSLIDALLVHNDIEADAYGIATTVGDIIDTLGYDGVIWILDIGDITATGTINASVYDDDAVAMGTEAEIVASRITALTAAGGDSNEMVVIQILRPKKRYCRIKVVTGTAGADLGVMSLRWRGRREPVTQVAVSEAIKLVSP